MFCLPSAETLLLFDADCTMAAQNEEPHRMVKIDALQSALLIETAIKTGLQHYAAHLIAASKRGHPLNFENLERIRLAAETSVKNISIPGISIEDDADVINAAVRDFEESIENILKAVRKEFPKL
jgi:hypothetical protein